MKSKSQFIFFLILILIIVFLAGAAVYWWISYKNLQTEISQKKKSGNMETYLPKDNLEVPEKKESDVYEVDPDDLIPISSQEEEILDETTDWLTYKNLQYSFEIKYPDKYETIEDTYGWEHALIHLIENNGNAQAYRGQIEVWDTEEGFQDKYKKSPPFITQDSESGKYITINYAAMSNEIEIIEDWNGIIDSFKFVR